MGGRIATTLAVSGGLFGAAGFSGAATAASDRTYAYVALGSTYVIGPGLAAGAVGQSTGVHVAPLGEIEFVAERDQFSLTLDDLAVVEGTVHVSVSHQLPGGSHWTHRHLCVPVRQPTTIAGVAAGRPVRLAIWDPPVAYTAGCDRGGSTGTATIAL